MRRWLLLCIAFIGAPCFAQHELTDDNRAEWVEYLQPDEAESGWCATPWRLSFREGVRDSQIEGKPILLWAMNGHPMGCV